MGGDMKQFFKRLWCSIKGHRWEVDDGQNLLASSAIPWFKCKHCGKRENTL
jgi:hypothetical protein